MTSLFIPLLLVLVGAYGIYKKLDIFSLMIKGAKSGLSVVTGILPALTILLSAVYMLRASGATDAIAEFLAPLFQLLGIPSDCAPLMLLRPISGSGALAIGSEIMERHGADSFIGRCAAVMLGSTETTFYVIALYFGSLGIKKTRHTVPAALMADLTGFIVAALSVRLISGRG